MKNTSKKNLEAIDPKRLALLVEGDPVAQYWFFTNLTFVKRENGHVTLRDKNGNEKQVYESLFMKYGLLSRRNNSQI